MNVPKLRFQGFEGEWEKKKLGSVVKVNPPTTALPERFIYIDLESVISGELIKEDIICKHDAPSRAQRVLKQHDVLFQMVRPYQKNNFYFNKEGDYVASTGYAQLRSVQDSKFVFQYLHFQDFVDNVIEKCTGTSYPAINSTDLSNILFSYPSLAEQSKIASFLTAVDDKISQLKRKKKLLEQYKKGLMQKIFSQEIRFKEDDGTDLPDWEEKKLGEVYSFRSTNSYSRDNLNYEEGEIKNIHYGDIHTKFQSLFDIKKESVPFINQEIPLDKVSSNSYCRQGDLIIADASEDYADIGKCIEIINVDDQKIIAGLHTLHARPNLCDMSIGFGCYLMKSRDVRLQIMTIAQGTKVLSISANRLSGISLSIPCPKEQTKITNFLSAIDDKINHTAALLEKTQHWKKGLLQQMFC